MQVVIIFFFGQRGRGHLLEEGCLINNRINTVYLVLFLLKANGYSLRGGSFCHFQFCLPVFFSFRGDSFFILGGLCGLG